MSHRPASSSAPPAGRSIPRARRMIIACGGMAVFLAAASVLAAAASATPPRRSLLSPRSSHVGRHGWPRAAPQDRRHEPGVIIANVGGDVADVRVSACGAAQRRSRP
jgi:hypothetical protein